MKTPALILTNLRRVIRNWKSIILLTGLPLLIVGLIFVSFSPDSVKVKVGTVDKTENFSYSSFKDSIDSFADVEEFNNLGNCLKQLKSYRKHLCAVIDRPEDENQYKMNIYYDNTKEVIDRIALNGLEVAADSLQLEYSEQQASKALREIENVTEDIRSARKEINQTDQKLKKEIEKLDQKIESLKKTRNDLTTRFKQMDRNVNQAEEDIEELNKSRKEFYGPLKQRIDSLQDSLETIDNETDDDIEEVDEARKDLKKLDSDLDSYNENTKESIAQANLLISNYRDFREDSKKHLQEINDTIDQLRDTQRELSNYRDRLQKIDSRLKSMEEEYSSALEYEASEIAKAISVQNRRAYSPDKTSTNLLTLQTVYSTLLLLVALFVSVLVSMFVTLDEINSAARSRLDVTPGTFMSEYVSLFITSLILVIIPVICVIAFGNYFFQLPILAKIGGVSLTLLLFCSSLINLGITISYLIKDKSITLLIGSFLIISLIFLSGFVLPTEMMTAGPRLAAQILPVKVAQETFDLIVLYGKPISEIQTNIAILGAWTAAFGLSSLYLKKKT